MSFYISSGVITPPLTAGAVAYGTGSTALMNSAGTASQVLLSGGAGAPTWASVSTVVPQATATVPGTVYGRQTTSGGTPFLTAYGYNAGVVNTGVDNTFVGVSAGLVNTSGTDNVAVGYQSLKANISGSSNTTVGVSALVTNTANNNTALGFETAKANTTGHVTAVGHQVLQNNTTGTGNVGVGGNDTAVGSALGSNVSGSYNTAMGVGALKSNTGNNSCAFGYQALELSSTAGNNVAIGYNAMRDATTSTNNVAIGYRAGLLMTTGTGENVAIGYQALLRNTTGKYNIAIGSGAMETNQTSDSSVAIGFGSLSVSTNQYNTGLGTVTCRDLTTGTGNVGVGSHGLLTTTTGSGNTAINMFNGSGAYAPVFTVTTENNRFVAGSSGLTNAYIQVAWTVVSDARDKMNFAPVPHGLDFVNKLDPVQFQFKETRESNTPNGRVRYGFKAQDILELEGDNSVIIDNDDNEKLRYNGESLVPVLVKALQELNAKFELYKEAHP